MKNILISWLMILCLCSCEEEEARLFFSSRLSKKIPKKESVRTRNINPVQKYLHNEDSFVTEDLRAYFYKNNAPLIYRQEKVWVSTGSRHYFSDTSVQDVFLLQIVGDKDFTSMVYLMILQQNNQVIYADTFPFIGLLSTEFDGDGYFATETQQEKFARKYADRVFDDDKFTPVTYLVYDHQQMEYPLTGYTFQYRVNKTKSVKISCNPTDKKVDKIILY